MKKSKVLAAIACSAVMVASGVVGLVACGTGNNGDTGDKRYTLNMSGLLAAAQDLGYEGTLEELVAAVKGEKGEKGDKGDKGDQGAKGVGIKSIEKTDYDGNVDIYTVTYTDDTTSTFTITNGEKGDKGDRGLQGVSITGVEIDADGNLSFTLSEGEPVEVANIADVLRSVSDQYTVTYYYYSGSANENYDDEYANALFLDGGKQMKWNAVKGDAIIDASVYPAWEETFEEQINEYIVYYEHLAYLGDGDWYFQEKGKLKPWSFKTTPLLQDMDLYYIAEKEESQEVIGTHSVSYDFNLGGDLTREALVGTAGFVEVGLPDTWPTEYSTDVGAVEPAYTAYRRYTNEGTEMLQVFTGWKWVFADGDKGDLTFKAQWKTVDYGYKSPGMTLSNAGALSANVTPYAATEEDGSVVKTVIISGDDVLSMTGNWFYQSQGTGVERIYVITDMMTSIVSGNTFSNMRDIRTVVLDAPSIAVFSNPTFTAGNATTAKALEAVALLLPSVTNKTLYTSMFDYQKNLKAVKLSDNFTIWNNYVFRDCAELDLEANFGWDYLNSLTVIGTDALQGNLTLPEDLVLGDAGKHFTGINALTSSSASNFLKANNNIKSITVLHYGTTLGYPHLYAFGFSSAANTVSENLESVEIHAPNITTADKLTFQNLTKLTHIYAFMPKVANTGSGYVATNVFGASSALVNVPVQSMYVTQDTTYRGNQDAIFIVGNLLNNGNMAGSNTSLKEITYDVASLTTIMGVNNCTELVTFTVNANKNQLNYLSSSAFNGDKNLQYVFLPETDTDYMTGNNSFNGGYATFKGCVNLRYISTFEQLKSFITQHNATGSPFGSNGIPLEAPVFKSLKDSSGVLYWGTTIIGAEGLKGTLAVSSTVTEISAGAFYGASELTAVDFSQATALTKVGDNAFQNCANLETVTFHANNTLLTSIGKNAFNNCAVLNNVDLTPLTAIATIGDSAFANCSGLTDISLPTVESYTQVAKSFFESCISLTSVVIPAQITVLGDSIFFKSGLTSIEFRGENKIETVGNYLFNSIPATTTEDNTNQAQAILNNLTAAMKKPAAEGEFILPAYLFYNCAEIKAINIPAVYTQIGNLAFDGCEKIESITFEAGSKCTVFGSGCFDPDAPVTTFKVPAGVKDFNIAFKSLATLEFEGGSQLEKISASFGNNTASVANKTLKVLNIPSTCTQFSSYGFQNMELTKINTITWNAQQGKWDVEEDALYLSFTGANVSAPSLSATKIKQLTIHVTSASTTVNKYLNLNGTFQNCTLLDWVALDYFYVQIANNAFAGCENLKYLKTSANTTYSSNAFTNCSKLETVELFASAANKYGNSAAINTVCAGIGSDGAATAFANSGTSTTSYANTAWNKMYSNLATDSIDEAHLIIGEGITAYANYAFYHTTTEADVLANFHIYYDTGASQIGGTGNTGYTNAQTHTSDWDRDDIIPPVTPDPPAQSGDGEGDGDGDGEGEGDGDTTN